MHKPSDSQTIHVRFAPIVAYLMIGQIVFGIYLKYSLERGRYNKYIRRIAVIFHGTLGKITPIISWIQMVFGGIAFFDFCQGTYSIQVRFII
jgi:hypothetical protein